MAIFVPDTDISSMPGASTAKSLHMIFVVDNSGSMRITDNSGIDRMTAVNHAFSVMIPELQDLQANVQDAFTIYISIMFFNEDPEWHVKALPISNYDHQDIAVSPYVTYYSRAYQELNAQLSSHALISQPGKKAAPYIMLMTDGAPTPGDDYESAIDVLKGNGWYDASQRYAVLIGEDTINDPDARQAVASFVTDPSEGIINAVDAQEIVRAVSAKTIHIAEQMTHRANPTAGQDNDSYDPFTPSGSGDNNQVNNDPWKNFGGDNSQIFNPNLIF
jgi:uncharacterized protein YegL